MPAVFWEQPGGQCSIRNKSSQEKSKRVGLRGNSVPVLSGHCGDFYSELVDPRTIFSRVGLCSDLHFVKISLACGKNKA